MIFPMPGLQSPHPFDLLGHVALVTGANHGIGAATAIALAGCGAAVLVSYLRSENPEDYPEPYRTNRTKGTEETLDTIRNRGGRAISKEADLRESGIVPQ
jgi:3-oxoacyl-[acyl-carrier protein] reductase